MMNKRISELMVLSGYAAPQMAPRANKLVNYVIADIVDIINSVGAELMSEDEIKLLVNAINKHYEH